LRTTPTLQEGELERRTRGLLLEATSNLNRTDYGRLNPDAKGQYDSAKGFVRQAEDALRTKNFVFASYRERRRRRRGPIAWKISR
jgi:hypothetical protein